MSEQLRTLTAERDALKGERDRAVMEALELILKETNTTVEQAAAQGGSAFDILRNMVKERDALAKRCEAMEAALKRIAALTLSELNRNSHAGDTVVSVDALAIAALDAKDASGEGER